VPGRGGSWTRSRERADRFHPPATARAEIVCVIGEALWLSAIAKRRVSISGDKQRAAQREFIGTAAVGEEAVIADAMESVRQGVEQEAADEFVGRHRRFESSIPPALSERRTRGHAGSACSPRPRSKRPPYEPHNGRSASAPPNRSVPRTCHARHALCSRELHSGFVRVVGLGICFLQEQARGAPTVRRPTEPCFDGSRGLQAAACLVWCPPWAAHRPADLLRFYCDLPPNG